MVEDRAGAATRAALVTAAERLMAEHGIEAAHLHQINRLAGQRNKAAVHYHFGDRDGLLRAIEAKHRGAINAERHQVLDDLQRAGPPSVRDLVEAFLVPFAAALADPSGRDYIIIMSERAGRRGSRWLLHPEGVSADSLHRLSRLLLAALPGSPAARRELVGYTMLTVPVLLADIARDVNHHDLTPRTIKIRVRRVVDFITRAITVGP